MKNIFSFMLIAVFWASPVCAEITTDATNGVTDEPKSFTYVDQAHLKLLSDLHKKAERLITADKLEEAAKVYDEIILEEPDDETAYTQLGHISLVMGRPGKAEIAYRNALAINPDNDEAWQGLDKIKNPDGMRTVPFSESVQESSTPAPAAASTSSETKTPWKIKVQTALKNTGLYTGPVDGNLNADTRHAVMKFQEQHNLKIDGIVGPKTWAQLEPYLESKK